MSADEQIHFEISDLDKATETDLNRFAKSELEYWKENGFKNRNLWDEYVLGFEGWTSELFAKVDRHTRSKLRDHLIVNGVYMTSIGKLNKRLIAEQLMEPLQAKTYHVFTQNDELEWSDKRDLPVSEPSFGQKVPKYSSANPTSLTLKREGSTQSNDYPPTNLPIRDFYGKNKQNTENSFEKQPQKWEERPQPKCKQLEILAKLYKDQDRYTGDNDSFDYKLLIFYDLCRQACVQHEYYAEALTHMLSEKAKDIYLDSVLEKPQMTFEERCIKIKSYFETPAWKNDRQTVFNTLMFDIVLKNHPEKSMTENFNDMETELRRVQRGMDPPYSGDLALWNRIVNACFRVRELRNVLFRPADTAEAVCSDIRAALAQCAFDDPKPSTHYMTERRYHTVNKKSSFPRNSYRQNNKGTKRSIPANGFKAPANWVNKCIVCQKAGCWSSNHPKEQVDAAFNSIRKRLPSYDNGDHIVRQYILQYEGESAGIDEISKYWAEFTGECSNLADTDPDSGEEEEEIRVDDSEQNIYLQEIVEEIGGEELVTHLNNKTAEHVFTAPRLLISSSEGSNQCVIYSVDSLLLHKYDINQIPEPHNITLNRSFQIDNPTEDRYSAKIFQGVLVDTGAAGKSTAGIEQVKALQRIRKDLIINTSTSGTTKIKGIGAGVFSSIGSVDVETPIGTITFHVVPCAIPFLLGLEDLSRLKCNVDIQKNEILQNGKRKAFLIRKYGHIWITLGHVDPLYITQNDSLPCVYLTESELRTIHRRFGHPSASRLYKTLQRAGHDTNFSIIERLTKYCRECQLHANRPLRFKFSLRKDAEFNHTIYTDVLYLEDGPVLHIIDSATQFGAAEWLKNLSTSETWNALVRCWMSVYIGPPEHIIHDAGTNFASAEFRKHCAEAKIEVIEVPTESHNSVGKVESAHKPLRRAYEIFKAKLAGQGVDKQTILKLAVKACNDTAGPNGLVPTLCVFGAYPRITWDDAPTPIAVQRADAIRNAMRELRKLQAKRYVEDARKSRNGPACDHLHDVEIGGKVRVWREGHQSKGKWTGPWELIDKNRETVVVKINGEHVNFRSTVVKKWREDTITESQTTTHENAETINEQINPAQITQAQLQSYPRRSERAGRFEGTYKLTTNYSNTPSKLFLSSNEVDATRLSKELRTAGLITTPGKPFEDSIKQEIKGLLDMGVFEFLPFSSDMIGKRIFKSRIVNTIKGEKTLTPREKSRLVVQAYNDRNKSMVLTQSPTVQRSSIRLILALAPTFMQSFNMFLFVRDITQAYIQSKTSLVRDILCYPPPELIEYVNLPPKTIMRIKKPLYGIPEAGNHWFGTIISHLKEKLNMSPSNFDPCLLFTCKQPFGITGLQVDDTLFLGTSDFVQLENTMLKKAQFKAKETENLTPSNSLSFNGLNISWDGNRIWVQTKGQASKIKLVNSQDPDHKSAYKRQRARAAWISSICKPLQAFALSRAAQFQEPNDQEIEELNTALKELKDCPDDGLSYIPVDIKKGLALYIFIDGSFANNKDLTSQIGFVFVLGNETSEEGKFIIRGNIISWSSTKCRRVTRAVLASELYAMTNGIDLAIPLTTSINQIMSQLELPQVPLIVCTDSLSLYECLVKLGSTREKRLMIDTMAIRESYERKEITEIRWINGKDNPADAMTKLKPTTALCNLIRHNELSVRIQGWIDRNE